MSVEPLVQIGAQIQDTVAESNVHRSFPVTPPLGKRAGRRDQGQSRIVGAVIPFVLEPFHKIHPRVACARWIHCRRPGNAPFHRPTAVRRSVVHRPVEGLAMQRANERILGDAERFDVGSANVPGHPGRDHEGRDARPGRRRMRLSSSRGPRRARQEPHHVRRRRRLRLGGHPDRRHAPVPTRRVCPSALFSPQDPRLGDRKQR